MLTCKQNIPEVGPASGSIASILTFTGPVGAVALGSGKGGMDEPIPED